MQQKLFRDNALKHQRDRLFGAVMLTQPVSLSIISSVIVFVVVAVAFLLVFGSYPRKQVANGYLVPKIGMAKIYATKSGVLSRLAIEEGAVVKKGQLMFIVATQSDDSTGVDKDSALLTKNIDQKALLQDRIRHEEKLVQSRLDFTDSQLEGLKREYSQLKESIDAVEQGVASSGRLVQQIRIIGDRGPISKLEMEQINQRYLDRKIELENYKTLAIQLENKIEALVRSRVEIKLQWVGQRAKLDQDYSVLEQQSIELSSRREYAIRAPIAGVVTALQTDVGHAVGMDAPLVTVLPEGNGLQAELFLPTRAVGLIETEQAVFIRFHSFPYQRYGVHSGTIDNLAKVILAPDEIPAPFALAEPMYKALVTLESQEISAHGKNIPLQAGMMFSADIILDERNLLEWLLDPILGLRGKR